MIGQVMIKNNMIKSTITKASS